MPRHVKPKHTRAVFIRKVKTSKDAEKENADDKTEGRTSHQHDLPAIPSQLQPVLRKPLNTFYTSKKLRKHNRRRERDLLRAIDQRLDVYARSFGGQKIHPIAVLAWLSSEESFKVEFLLENSNLLVDTPSEDEDDDTYKAVDPVLIAELDGLLDRFAKATTIDNAPSSIEHGLLKVPKDFSMAQIPHLIAGYGDYDVLMADMEKDQERAWSFPGANFTKQKDKEKLGFDPVQVLKKHAIQFHESDMPKLSTLDNAIHSVFKLENFHGCSDAIYSVLTPGLRLASLLITHRSTSAFWHTLKFGRREPTFRNLHWAFKIPEIVPWTAATDTKWKAYLQDVSKKIHITFSLWPTAKDYGVYTYGTMHPVRDYKTGYQGVSSSDEHGTNGGYRAGRINLNMDFYTTAKRLSLLRSADPAMTMRFGLFLAINVCHEFAHYVEMDDPVRVPYKEQFGSGTYERPSEAYFLDQDWTEAGAAFETYVFGGKIQPISCRTDCMYGLCTYDEVNETKAMSNPSDFTLKMRTFWTVPMRFVVRCQQKSEWAKRESGDAEDGEWLKVPRDGATAVRVPYFDMTVWKDEAENPISDDSVSGRDTPFLRTKDGRIEKRKSPLKIDVKKVEKALGKTRSPLSNHIDKNEEENT